MYIFKLYEMDRPLQPVDARLLQEGTLRIGRAPEADWVVQDPTYQISRWHCEYDVQPAGLVLRCQGTNGVFDGITEARLPDQQDLPVAPPASIYLGPYRLTVELAVQAQNGSDENQTLIMMPPLGSSVAVPTQWSDASPLAGQPEGGSLLEAFCHGAGIDSSAFSSEDPEEIMRRAGAVYRNMVLGIGDLMAERERVRGHYQLARTTIGGAGNNPFKWAPSQRLAIDLLLTNDRGFLDGPTALSASFRDIKKHLIATFSGLRASLRAAIDMFEPASVAEASSSGGRSMLKSRAVSQCEVVFARHADLLRQIDGQEEGNLARSFVAAYDAAAADLDAQHP